MQCTRVRTDFLFPTNLAVISEARPLDVSLEEGAAIEGRLASREEFLLYMLARRAAALGDTVEIGSFKGRSTWHLARGLADAGSAFRVVAIDPHLEGTEEQFEANIASPEIRDRIEVRKSFSYDEAPDFGRPVGLLWIDGEHSYSAVRRDFDDWFPWVAEGGWIAVHDTVNLWYGPTRLMRELLGRRNDLARVGVVGSITYMCKSTPSPVNRLRGLMGRFGFELVILARARVMGRGPLLSGEDERAEFGVPDRELRRLRQLLERRLQGYRRAHSEHIREAEEAIGSALNDILHHLTVTTSRDSLTEAFEPILEIAHRETGLELSAQRERLKTAAGS